LVSVTFSKAEEITGKLSKQDIEDKLMHSVIENDKKTIEEGKLIKDSINQGISSFTPDLMFEQLCKNYSMAKNLFGESLIKLLSGYNPNYIEKNIQIPELMKALVANRNKEYPQNIFEADIVVLPDCRGPVINKTGYFLIAFSG